MNALPTTYKGIRFRSRLEADWALNLDEHSISWQYEPEGYLLSTGEGYAPDFWLPSARAWLEVKGSHMERVSKVDQFAGDLWGEATERVEKGEVKGSYFQDMPMVLLGLEPDDNLMRLIGVMGPGRRSSVGVAMCPRCRQGTVIYLWQSTCRNCGENSSVEKWQESHYSFHAYAPWKRVRRPVGMS